MKRSHLYKYRSGFTLVELLVSMVLITLLMVMLVSMTDATRRTWSYTTSKVEQFRGAREAFEAVTRRLSQATLNTYWDYDNTILPTKYQRQSELRFISGNSADLTGLSASPTHAVFFQAPLGFVSDKTKTINLENLLNTWGYFVEFADDSQFRPPFVTSQIVPYRSRFRLMEMMEPSDKLALYKYTNGKTVYSGSNCYNKTTWFTDPLGSGTSRPVRPLAENIIALILLPKLALSDQKINNYTDASLAPFYRYDSTGVNMTTVGDANLNPTNQLPPVIQITMVALDETSANRMSASDNSKLLAKLGTLFTDATKFNADLRRDPANSSDTSLERYLIDNRINYRIFTTDVSLKSAKWSREQKN